MSEAATGPQFTVHRIRRGYNMADVDALLDQVAVAIRDGGPVPDVTAARFTASYGGYDENEVDDFLDDLAQQLGQV